MAEPLPQSQNIENQLEHANFDEPFFQYKTILIVKNPWTTP